MPGPTARARRGSARMLRMLLYSLISAALAQDPVLFALRDGDVPVGVTAFALPKASAAGVCTVEFRVDALGTAGTAPFGCDESLEAASLEAAAAWRFAATGAEAAAPRRVSFYAAADGSVQAA